MRIVIAIVLLFAGGEVFAQEGASAAEHLVRAREALEAGDLERAMLESERSWRLEERPEALAVRVRVLEAMKEYRLALDIIEQNRALLAGQTEVFLVEERLRGHLRAEEQASEAVDGASASRTTLNTVGPAVLGALGLGLGVGATLSLWPDACDTRLSDGTCWEEDRSSVGAGIGLGAAGVAALTGAVVWWVLGAPEADTVGDEQ